MFKHNLKYSLKILLKNKSLIFWTFVFPILLGTLFKMAFSNIENSETLKIIDIAIVNKKIAIEIDGEQHYLDPKIIKSDKRKNKFLTENGWNIIRIKWSDYQKFNKIEKEDYINKIIDYIKSK
jgi:very-short-patch-repair endonuclease